MEMRTTKPGAGNKYYIRKASGGWSNAIQGKPVDAECDVLSNCVGYAYGRFNEIGGYGYCKYLAPVNAENFMQYKGSCKTGTTPKVGACMVWEGAGSHPGHVAIVEKVIDNNTVYTSESGYGGKAFWNQTRSNSNGRWGANTNYKFLGFIYNPAVKDTVKVVLKSTDAIAKEVIEGKWGNGADRKSRLTAAGYNYSEVQAAVNALVGGSKAPAASTSIAVGDSVKVKEGAKTYTGQGLAAFVYRRTYTVSEVSGDRVVIKFGSVVIAAMNKKDLIKV